MRARHSRVVNERNQENFVMNTLSKETKRNLALASAGLVDLASVFEGLDLEKQKRINEAKQACAERRAGREALGGA